MDKYLIYQIRVAVSRGEEWTQFFIGFPTNDEVLLAIEVSLKESLDEITNCPEQQRQVTDTYGNYSQLVSEQRLPDKPGPRSIGYTTRICKYAGAVVGRIEARIPVYAFDTRGAQDV